MNEGLKAAVIEAIRISRPSRFSSRVAICAARWGNSAARTTRHSLLSVRLRCSHIPRVRRIWKTRLNGMKKTADRGLDPPSQKKKLFFTPERITSSVFVFFAPEYFFFGLIIPQRPEHSRVWCARYMCRQSSLTELSIKLLLLRLFSASSVQNCASPALCRSGGDPL